jgi:uncharacterized alkaline shock family protein YloU
MSMSSGNEASKNRGTTATAEREATQVRPEERHGGPELGAPTAVALKTETGTTRIADSVVAKIAGLAARDIPGVFAMGTGMSRRVGQLRSLIPGTSDASASQGVAVEVGEREAAIDLNLVTWYGQSIVDISEAVRRNCIGQVEGMTGLKVIEVNIQIDDIHVESDDGSQRDQPHRVQ